MIYSRLSDNISVFKIWLSVIKGALLFNHVQTGSGSTQRILRKPAL
jgi:hypothetical protein